MPWNLLDELGSSFVAACQRAAVEPTKVILHAHLVQKFLRLHTPDSPPRTYPIAISAAPPSCVQDSLGTPWGLHEIAEKHGSGAPSGMIFQGRRPTGEVYTRLPPTKRNLITSRILWLRGLENGVNAGPGVDTFSRYIYIHGTNHEHPLGGPGSHGCLLLSNADVIDLHDRVPVGALVWLDQG